VSDGVIDLPAIVRAAVAAEVAPLRKELAEVRAAVARPPVEAEPLSQILGGTAARARMMEARHADLRALSVGMVGRRRVYRRSDVLNWIASRAEHPASRGRPPGPAKPRAVEK